MNAHIELVKKWLANPESVTQQELSDNRTSAYADTDAAYDAAYMANSAAADAAYWADEAANSANSVAADAAYWVKLYEELTK